MRHLLSTILMLSAAATASGQTPAERYRAIIDEYEVAKKDFARREAAARSDEDREKLRREYPSYDDYYPKLLAFAEANPRDPAAVDALVWMLAMSTRGYDAFKERGVRTKRAMDILLRDHLGDERVGRACLVIVNAASPLRDEFLPAVYARSAERKVRGRACLALAEYLTAKSQSVAYLQGPAGDETIRQVAAQAPHRLAYCEGLRKLDLKSLKREAENLFERTIEEYGDIPYDPALREPAAGKTLAEVAIADLKKIRNLAVGQPAPEIEGSDSDGRPFRLSDYRGKVVLLTFSGNWCGPCKAMYPAERALVERFKGRPFALLSVSTDQNRATLQKSIDSGEITWRCWWEPGTTGPICAAWMVNSFPTTYILDAQGLIRHEGVRDEKELSKAIEALFP
jgi:peroxiredoxin